MISGTYPGIFERLVSLLSIPGMKTRLSDQKEHHELGRPMIDIEVFGFGPLHPGRIRHMRDASRTGRIQNHIKQNVCRILMRTVYVDAMNASAFQSSL